jgi:hypothetical protein
MSREKLTVLGRDVLLETGKVTQTVNVFRVNGKPGDYAPKIRLRGRDRFVTCEELKSQNFTSIQRLVDFLKDRGGRVEVEIPCDSTTAATAAVRENRGLATDGLVRAKQISGPAITSVDSWGKLTGAVGRGHWKEYRSAMELARAWFRTEEATMPEELVALLETSRQTRNVIVHRAVAEMRLRLDDLRGNSRNSDIVVFGQSGRHRIVATVEAKADEFFDTETIGTKLKNVSNPRSGIPKRVAQLAEAVFGHAVDDSVCDLRYQLLHALAATAVLAKEEDAEIGVLVIHEFVSLTLDFENLVRNANDLQQFVSAIPDWEDEVLEGGRLLPPVQLHGNGVVPSAPPVTIGKIRTLIPLGAGGRSIPDSGPHKKGQFLISH